jgi:mannose-6-phosphate isomerase-like protein (cupin superfamily)
MATKHQVLDMTPVGMRFTVLNSSTDTNGKSLDLEWEILPGCNMKDSLIHVHPNAIETYEMLEGELEFFVKDKWMTLKKGEKLAVEKGVYHSFRNPTNGIAKVFNTHQPALKMEDYFEGICKAVNKATDNGKRDLKMDMKSKIYMSVLVNKYRNEIVMKTPPVFVIKAMDFIGRLTGIRF